MKLIVELNASTLNADFVKSVRAAFGKRDMKIVIEDLEKGELSGQQELYQQALALRKRFRNVQVAPTSDLSALAGEVNL